MKNAKNPMIIRRRLMDMFYTANRNMLQTEISQIELGVSERSICASLKSKLESLLLEYGFDGYFVDVEYNRGKGGMVKAISVDGCTPVPITCDLIIHSRGKRASDNLLCLEMKKRGGSGVSSDKKRLRILTSNSHDVYTIEFQGNRWLVADYLVGIYYEYDAAARNVYFEYYADGKMQHSESMSFAELMSYVPLYGQ